MVSAMSASQVRAHGMRDTTGPGIAVAVHTGTDPGKAECDVLTLERYHGMRSEDIEEMGCVGVGPATAW